MEELKPVAYQRFFAAQIDTEPDQATSIVAGWVGGLGGEGFGHEGGVFLQEYRCVQSELKFVDVI